MESSRWPKSVNRGDGDHWCRSCRLNYRGDSSSVDETSGHGLLSVGHRGHGRPRLGAGIRNLRGDDEKHNT